MKNSIYYKQAELLLNVLPLISRDNELALKGGTAINFFIRNLPRISVDIDLAFLPLKNRDESLRDITEKLRNISSSISRTIADTQNDFRFTCSLIRIIPPEADKGKRLQSCQG